MKLSLKKKLRLKIIESILLINNIFSVYLIMILLTYDSNDKSWSHVVSYNNIIYNAGGKIGAILSDILFFIFGSIALTLPIMIIYFSWKLFFYMKYPFSINYLYITIHIIGYISLIFTSCTLLSLHIDNINNYYSSGGIIGILIADSILPWFNKIGSTIILFSIWMVSLTLITETSILSIMYKITYNTYIYLYLILKYTALIILHVIYYIIRNLYYILSFKKKKMF